MDMGFPFRDNEHVMRLHGGSSCTTLNTLKTTELSTLKGFSGDSGKFLCTGAGPRKTQPP